MCSCARTTTVSRFFPLRKILHFRPPDFLDFFSLSSVENQALLSCPNLCTHFFPSFFFQPRPCTYGGRAGIIDQFLPQEMWEGIKSPPSFPYSPLQTDFCASKRGGRGRFFSVFSADTRSQTSVHCLIYGTVYERSFFAYLLHHATFARLKGEKKIMAHSGINPTCCALRRREWRGFIAPSSWTDHRLTEVENLKYGFYFPPPPPPPRKRSGFRYCTRNSDCRVIDGCDTIRHWVCVGGRLLLVFSSLIVILGA